MFSVLSSCFLVTEIILDLPSKSFQVLVIDEFIENSIYEMGELIRIQLFVLQKKKIYIIKNHVQQIIMYFSNLFNVNCTNDFHLRIYNRLYQLCMFYTAYDTLINAIHKQVIPKEALASMIMRMLKENEKGEIKRLLPKGEKIQLRSGEGRQTVGEGSWHPLSLWLSLMRIFPCAHHVDISFFPFLHLEEPGNFIQCTLLWLIDESGISLLHYDNCL